MSPVPSCTGDTEVQAWYDHQGRVCAYGYTAEAEHWMRFPGLATYRFGAGEGVTALAPPGASRDVIVDTYYRTVLPMALQVRGTEVLHASAVVGERGVIVLCAAAETGKSTIACGLRERGFTLWADDAVAFDTSGESVRATPLPFRLRLRPSSAAFFGRAELDGRAPLDWETAASAHAEPSPVATVFVLTRLAETDDGAGVTTSRLSPACAFRGVLAHARCFNPRDRARKRRMLLQYLDLVARVPVFELRFQAGLRQLATILDSIEGSVAAC